MKPPVPSEERAKGITFSLKADLYQALLRRVEQMGYPWTKSSYITSLVMEDLKKEGLWPPNAAAPEEVDAFIERRQARNVSARARRRSKSEVHGR